MTAAIAASVLSSCGGQPTGPSLSASLRLTAAIAQPVVTRDNPVALTFRLENVGTESITLTFPNSCQINPYVIEGPTARRAVPQGGDWSCAAVITRLKLGPGAVALNSFFVRTEDAPTSDGAVPLAAGEYFAYARVDADELRLRSADVIFRVQ